MSTLQLFFFPTHAVQFYWQLYFDLNVHNNMQFVIVVNKVKWTGTEVDLVSDNMLVHIQKMKPLMQHFTTLTVRNGICP